MLAGAGSRFLFGADAPAQPSARGIRLIRLKVAPEHLHRLLWQSAREEETPRPRTSRSREGLFLFWREGENRLPQETVQPWGFPLLCQQALTDVSSPVGIPGMYAGVKEHPRDCFKMGFGVVFGVGNTEQTKRPQALRLWP